jgi:predicted acetyltransferase
VQDDFCPWNEGVYELEGGADSAQCRRAKGSPELALSAADLGAIYMGGVSATALLHAGRIEQLSDGAVERMDNMFRWSPGPWGAQGF